MTLTFRHATHVEQIAASRAGAWRLRAGAGGNFHILNSRRSAIFAQLPCERKMERMPDLLPPARPLAVRLLIASTILFRVSPCAALDTVSLITDFGYNGRHAYFFYALDQGYYRDAGLDVKILRGQGSVDAIRQVGAGNAMFGFADAGSLVLARANDQIPVKLAAIVYGKPPQAIFCREDAGLKEPKDLEGIAIANPAGGSIPDLFPAFAKAAGIDRQKVRWVVASSESLPGLLAANRVPCVGQFTVGEAMLRAQLAPARLVRFAIRTRG
jgi:NitT/TauT family transport system substrate-binding protein